MLHSEGSVLPPGMLSPAERWGTLMDLVCYWGRRGVLQPPPTLCVHVSTGGDDSSPPLPYFMLSAVKWNCVETQQL